MQPIRIIFALTAFMLAGTGVFAQSEGPRVDLRGGEHRAVVTMEGRPFGIYVWKDDAVPRPYWTDLRAPDGTPLTRNHPPQAEADQGNDDHADMHPGAWLAFGDLNGGDFWRNKGAVRHQGFTVMPGSLQRQGGWDTIFEVENHWFHPADAKQPIARERCEYTIRATGSGSYLFVRSRIYSMTGQELVFGDQEEMGFGVRLATGLTVKNGGWMENSEGGRGEAGTWGMKARWCAAGKTTADGQVLLMLMAGPAGGAPGSWFHTRDSGLMVANGFGVKAMTGRDDPSVAPAQTRRLWTELNYGLYLFSGGPDAKPELEVAWDRFRMNVKPR